MHLFIEMCNAKQTWLDLAASERQAFLEPVEAVMEALTGNGAEIIAWSFNDLDTPHRAGYDFVAVFLFPSSEDALEYHDLFSAAGWYDYFEQVNVSGAVQDYLEINRQLARL